MTRVRLAWLRDDPACLLAPLAARLGPVEATELAQLALLARQRGYLLSRALLRRLIAGEDTLAPYARFARAASGRLLLTAPAGWHISLSHGAGLVAAALAAAPCGVDIERPRPAHVQRVAARYFAPAEQAWLQALPPVAAERDFFRLWTLKEAAAKALGEGLAHNMARLAFSVAAPAPAFLEAGLGLQVWQAPVADAWLAAAVRADGPVDWQCREVSLAELLAP